jgi:hypothetical protein
LGTVARAVALLLVVAAAACGESEEAGQRAGPQTSIEVTLWPDGRGAGESRTVVLTCEPAGGSRPDPEEACAALYGEADALEPVASDVACTQIYGGPQEARIAGVVRGRAVDARFSRNNGCEIDRWERLAPLLEIAAG